MNRLLRTAIAVCGFAATTSSGALSAQNMNKTEPLRGFGIMNSLTSYHTDHDSYYNQFNPGLGVCHALNFGFLKRLNADMDAEGGFYYNSIRSITPFAAVTFQKKLGKWPVHIGIGAGVFGYQHKASPQKHTEKYPMPADGKIPASMHDGPVSIENWSVWGDDYFSMTIDKRARAEGPMHLYPMAVPRICVDLVDNKRMTLGFALQGGWLPKAGGLIGLSTYVFAKKTPFKKTL